jgi:two-component system, NarL family, invasion response regulator UvrY
MEACRVLLIDDHAVVRAGCRLLLQRRAEIAILEASNGAEGVSLAAEHQPQLIVLDLSLGDGSGFDIMQRLRAESPGTRILVFSMHEDPVTAARAVESGAAGYASKNDGPDTFLDAVDTVLRGDFYLGRAMAQKLALRQIRAGDNPLRSLSRRELDVLRLFGAGESLAEIADELQLSYRTVANSVSQIKRKLNVATNARLLRLAIDHMPQEV